MQKLYSTCLISMQLSSVPKAAPIIWLDFLASIRTHALNMKIYMKYRQWSVFLLNKRTVVEEQEHGKPQCRRGQQDQADVAGDHEVAHHQRHLVLIPAVPLWRRWRGIVAPTHSPLQWPPPLQRGGDHGARRATRGAQRPVGKNGGGWGKGTEWRWGGKK